jgi:hypothetical protein
MRARSGDGATKVEVHSASGPILLDHHSISVQAFTSPESKTLFFYCLLYQDARRLFSWILSASIYLSIEFE